jgi:hypothetical protein
MPPVRIPQETIKLGRLDENGKHIDVTPAIGKPFNFTEKEVADINAVRPQAFRKLIIEGEDEDRAAEIARIQEDAKANSDLAVSKATKGGKAPKTGDSNSSGGSSDEL